MLEIFEAGVFSIRFKSDLERIKVVDGGKGQGNDYAATVELINNLGASVELEGRISWQKNDTSMGVHIPNAKQSEQNELSELFPLLSAYADKLNIIIPEKNLSPESLLDDGSSTSISGEAHPPSSQYLCEFEPPEQLLTGSIKEIDGEGLCLDNKKTAQFMYTVSLDPNGGSEQTYNYEFKSKKGDQKFSDATISKSNDMDIVTSEDLKKGNSAGTITVGPGVESFQIEVVAKTEGKLQGDETLQLIMKSSESTDGSEVRSCRWLGRP